MRGNPPPACSPVRRPRKGRSRRIFLPGAGQRRHKARGPAFARRTFRQSPAEPGRGLHEAPFPPRFPRPSQTPSSLRFFPAQSGPWRQKRALFSAAAWGTCARLPRGRRARQEAAAARKSRTEPSVQPARSLRPGAAEYGIAFFRRGGSGHGGKTARLRQDARPFPEN